MSNSIKRVRDIKILFDKVLLPNYSYETNFSCAEFLVDINHSLIIKAKLEKNENQMIYKFVVDTQFLSNAEISYDEVVMLKKIIDILEENRKFVLSRLKKYTVEEYNEEERKRKEDSEKMLKALEKMIEMSYKKEYD